MNSASMTITLPEHTLGAYRFESGLRVHWPAEDRLTQKGYLTPKKKIYLSIGVKGRHTDPNQFSITATGLTEEEVDRLPARKLRQILKETARMKSGYCKPAAGPESLRDAVAERYRTHFGANFGIDQVLYGPGGASQALNDLQRDLFDREGVILIDLPCWPGEPPKAAACGPTPVGMFKCHESFEHNRKQLAPFIDRGIAGVYTSFPGSPIGLRLTPERLEVLTKTRLWLREKSIEADKRPPIWIGDEVYIDQPRETLSLLAGEDNGDVAVVYTLTKGRLQAGNRDHFLIVGDSPTLKKFLAAKAKDGLSGHVPWHYTEALEYAIRNSHDFLEVEREHDRLAGEAFAAAIFGTPGMEIDAACDNQYRYVHLWGIPEGRTSDDWKRFQMLEAAMMGGLFIDIVPGVYFNHPLLLGPAGILISEVDGFRTIMAFDPKTMAKAGRELKRQWLLWRKAVYLAMPSWKQIGAKLDEGMTPEEILVEAGYDVSLSRDYDWMRFAA